MPSIVKLSLKLGRETMPGQGVIETSEETRSKFDCDEESGLFQLAGLSPEGMSFPLDFGIFPSTKAGTAIPSMSWLCIQRCL